MTEKNYNADQKLAKVMKPQAKVEAKAPASKTKAEEKEIKAEEKLQKAEEKKEAKKPEVKRVKKSEAVVRGVSLPISTKISSSICDFIRHKDIQTAINGLQEVILQKRVMPMKGEYAHHKGGVAGRFPVKASEHFIMLLKSLQANANYNEMTEPVIKEAYANYGYRPFGRFGSVRRKRTHVTIKAVEKKAVKEKKK
jgi:ribosomal protein L22